MPVAEKAAFPTRPAAVIFDMDGLLFDSGAPWRDAFFAAAEELGHRFTTQDFLTLVGRPWSTNRTTLQEHLGSADSVETFDQIWMQHYQEAKATIRLKAGVIELLARLDELRLPRAICTSSSQEDVSYNLALHSLTTRFDVIVAAGDYIRGKPAPDPYLRAAEMVGVAPEVCLALEDSFSGVRSAAAAGMRTIMVPDLLPATDEMRLICHSVARDLHDVRALLG